MDSKKIKPLIPGILVFSLILLAFSYLFSLNVENSQELTVDSALTRIKAKEYKEAIFRQSQVEFKDLNGAVFVTTIGSDPMRETVLKAVTDFNLANESASIKTSEEPVSSGYNGTLLLTYFPFIIIFVLSVFIAFLLGKNSNKNKG